ncbi:MAG: hypothetical protein ABSC95_06805 [Acetobacteraceae bacterium]|jgi:hypothetical protein
MFCCLGMYASASTWTFNVVQQIAGTVAPTRPVMPVFVADAIPKCDDNSATLVVKTHGTPAARELGRRARAIIITIRDPRDAVASLMRHNKAPFDFALRVTEVSAWACARFVSHRRSVLLKFEDRFFDDPGTVERIAATFPGTLSESECRRIFERLRRDAVDAFIANLETLATANSMFDEMTGQWDTYDGASGWHKHHAGRDAEVGRWRRELADQQVLTVERRLRPWMERFGYLPITSRRDAYVLSVGQYGIVG